MTDKPKSTFARRVGAARPRDKRKDIRDDVVAALLIRVYPSGARAFRLERSVRGSRHYANPGDANSVTIPQAWREARRPIASLTEPTKQDNGPRTPGHPMTAFANEFLERQAHRWIPRTRDTNTRIVRNDILPAFGDTTVDAITVEQAKKWFAPISERPGVANRSMPILSAMMPMAELWGYRARNTNPCERARRFRRNPKSGSSLLGKSPGSTPCWTDRPHQTRIARQAE